VREALAGKTNGYFEQQELLLRQTRAVIVDEVKRALANGKLRVTFTVPETLTAEHRKRLAREIWDKFPDSLWQHIVVHYWDGETTDQWRLVQKDTVDHRATEYELRFD
jgi:hypothetical protein